MGKPKNRFPPFIRINRINGEPEMVPPVGWAYPHFRVQKLIRAPPVIRINRITAEARKWPHPWVERAISEIGKMAGSGKPGTPSETNDVPSCLDLAHYWIPEKGKVPSEAENGPPD